MYVYNVYVCERVYVRIYVYVCFCVCIHTYIYRYIKDLDVYRKQDKPKMSNGLATLDFSFHFSPIVLIVPREKYFLRMLCFYYVLF